MTVSRQPQINEELLSAYLDDQVTEEERALVEAAIATDPAIAWQVDSLRQTIHLLQELPVLTLPRSFTLEAILAEARAAEAPTVAQPEVIAPSNNAPKRPIVTRPTAEQPPNNWWQWFFDLWQGGNLQLRNAAAVALTLFFVLFAGDQFIVSTRPLVERNADAAPVVMTSAERAPAEAPVIAATAAELPATFTPQPTATSLPPERNTVTANPAPEDATVADTAQGGTANPNAARTLDTQSPPLAADRSAPGPVEEDFTGGGGPGSDARSGGAEALTQESYSAKEGGDQGNVAQLTAPSAPMNPVTEPQILTATTLVTTAPTTALTTATSIATLVTSNITTTDVITTAAVTTTVATTSPIVSASKPSAVAPTVAGGRADWLTWAQVISAFSTVVLASLWWRSRR